MSTPTCPYEPATVAFLYGEGPAEHADHVATCEVCAETARTHEAVVTALGPALGALAVRPHPRRMPARTFVGLGAVLALAAAALVAVGLSSVPPDVAPEGTPLAVRAADPVDAALDDLDLDLELAALELESP